MNKRMRGYVKSRPIQEDELSPVQEIDSEYELVYYPTYEGSTKIFWAKELKGSATLFYQDEKKSAAGMTSIDNLRKLVFVPKGVKKDYPIKWSQWLRLLENNKIDTHVEVEGEMTASGIIRIIPKRTAKEEELLAQLCSGFSSTDSVKSLISNYGFKLVPKSMMSMV